MGNLLLRHPGLKRLIDHPQGGEVASGAGDPFLMEERDPLLSNALLSSLWEIRALQWHILPSIASAARFIREPLPSVEYDMASALERTGGHLFDRELKNKVRDIMLTFERPNSMALPKGEKLLQYWQLTSTHWSLPSVHSVIARVQYTWVRRRHCRLGTTILAVQVKNRHFAFYTTYLWRAKDTAVYFSAVLNIRA